MPLYAFLCTIDGAKVDVLVRLRAEHYAFLIAHRARIRFGGPARASDSGRPETMIIIAEADDHNDAEAWIAGEPYNAAGAFRSVSVRPWSQVLPEVEPGALERTQREELAKRVSPSASP